MYVPEEEGDYEIFVKYDDVDIPDSPFKASLTFFLKIFITFNPMHWTTNNILKKYSFNAYFKLG